MIDIILAIIIGGIAFSAGFLMPSKTQIEKNETSKYKSTKILIYVIGGLAILIGVYVVYQYVTGAGRQDIIGILKIVVFFSLGAVIIVKNIQTSKSIAAFESGVAPVPVEVAAIPMTGTQTVTQSPVQAQQMGVKAQTVVQAQPQPQQVSVKAMPSAQARPQVQVQPQPQMVAQPAPVTPQPQPRIIVIKCPKCQGSMQINTAMLGQKMKCPHCGVEGRIG